MCTLPRPKPQESLYISSYEELLRFRHRLLAAFVVSGPSTRELTAALALMGNTAIRWDGAERLVSHPLWEEGEVEGSVGDRMMSMLTGPVGRDCRSDGEPLRRSDVGFLKRVKGKLVDASQWTRAPGTSSGDPLSPEELADRLVLSSQDTYDQACAVSTAWLRNGDYIWSQRGAHSVDTLLGNLKYLTLRLSLASYKGASIADMRVKAGSRELSPGKYLTLMKRSLGKLIQEPGACKSDGVIRRSRTPLRAAAASEGVTQRAGGGEGEGEGEEGDDKVSWQDVVYGTGPLTRPTRFGDLLGGFLASVGNTSRWCCELEAAVVRERGEERAAVASVGEKV